MSEEQLIQLGHLINCRAKAKFINNLDFASACDIDEKSIRRILNGKQNFSHRGTARSEPRAVR